MSHLKQLKIRAMDFSPQKKKMGPDPDRGRLAAGPFRTTPVPGGSNFWVSTVPLEGGKIEDLQPSHLELMEFRGEGKKAAGWLAPESANQTQERMQGGEIKRPEGRYPFVFESKGGYDKSKATWQVPVGFQVQATHGGTNGSGGSTHGGGRRLRAQHKINPQGGVDSNPRPPWGAVGCIKDPEWDTSCTKASSS